MLTCIKCGLEQPERVNTIQCIRCSKDNLHNHLYSTTFRPYKFEPSPIESKGFNLWLKREDKNKLSGTFKDRKTALLKNYLPDPYNRTYALASSGNMAISFVKIWSSDNFYYRNTYLWVSPHINFNKFQILKQYYEKIEFTDKILSTLELTKGESDRWNITNGMDPIGASAYYQLGFELEPYNFDNIIVPCGSGELYSALEVYFKKLRKNNHITIFPVTSSLPEADAIKTTYVPTQPFIDYFWDAGILEINDAERLKYYSELFNCEYSSATVFVAYEDLGLKGKTCLIVTGAKK